MSPRLKLLLRLGGLLLVLACVLGLARSQGPKDRPNFTGQDLEGRTWSLADYRGKQPVIVSFFGLT